MKDQDLKTIRKWFGNHIDGHELDELGFTPSVYQRIFFFEKRTRKEAQTTLSWLWDQIRIKGFNLGNRESIAVVGYPLTPDFQNWEIFADVSSKVAAAAVRHSASLIKVSDGVDFAMAMQARQSLLHVLPNWMLVEEDLFADRFCLFQTAAEVIALGKKAKAPKPEVLSESAAGGMFSRLGPLL